MWSSVLLATLTGVALLPRDVSGACTVVAYAMDLRTCFSKTFRPQNLGEYVIMIHNRPSMVETALQVEGFLDDPVLVCSKKTTFTSLFDCLGGTSRKCVSQDTELSYLPNATLTKQGLDYFCEHVEDIDTACYNESYNKVFECVKKLSAENIKSEDTDATKACTTVDITHDCIHANVMCDESTRDLLLKFQDEYWKPSGCPAPARSDRKKYIPVTGGSNAVALVSKVFCACLSFFIILLQH